MYLLLSKPSELTHQRVRQQRNSRERVDQGSVTPAAKSVFIRFLYNGVFGAKNDKMRLVHLNYGPSIRSHYFVVSTTTKAYV
jgi:hypothetical protein